MFLSDVYKRFFHVVTRCKDFFVKFVSECLLHAYASIFPARFQWPINACFVRDTLLSFFAISTKDLGD